MALEGVGRMTVVARAEPRKVLGIVTRSDLLKARLQHATEETTRERYFSLGRAP
jgi:CBS domain-containing protein